MNQAVRHPNRVALPRTKLQCLHWLRAGFITEEDLICLGLASHGDINSWLRGEEIAKEKGWTDLISQPVEFIEQT